MRLGGGAGGGIRDWGFGGFVVITGCHVVWCGVVCAARESIHLSVRVAFPLVVAAVAMRGGASTLFFLE